MKILDEGITKENWKKIIVCKKHLAKYEISYDDIKLICKPKETLFDSKKVLVPQVKLPCGCTVTLKNKDIPAVIKDVLIENLDVLDLLIMYFS